MEKYMNNKEVINMVSSAATSLSLLSDNEQTKVLYIENEEEGVFIIPTNIIDLKVRRTKNNQGTVEQLINNIANSDAKKMEVIKEEMSLFTVINSIEKNSTVKVFHLPFVSDVENSGMSGGENSQIVHGSGAKGLNKSFGYSEDGFKKKKSAHELDDGYSI